MLVHVSFKNRTICIHVYGHDIHTYIQCVHIFFYFFLYFLNKKNKYKTHKYKKMIPHTGTLTNKIKNIIIIHNNTYIIFIIPGTYVYKLIKIIYFYIIFLNEELIHILHFTALVHTTHNTP